jgi:histone H3/H4
MTVELLVRAWESAHHAGRSFAAEYDVYVWASATAGNSCRTRARSEIGVAPVGRISRSALQQRSSAERASCASSPFTVG